MRRWYHHLALVAGAGAVVGLVVGVGVVLRAAQLDVAADVAQLVSVLLGAPAVLVPLFVWWKGKRGVTNAPALDGLRDHLGRSRRLPQLAEVDPLALRVHRAIPSQKRNEEDRDDLPIFVRRNVSDSLTPWFRAARTTGGMLLLVGNSSVGKTRLLYELIRAELPGFPILSPDLGHGEVLKALAAPGFTLEPTVVWLDELHRFLDGPYLAPGRTPITAGVVRQLLDDRQPIVIVGTMWPEHARHLCATTGDDQTDLIRPLHPAAFDVLEDPRCDTVELRSFDSHERQRAQELASSDPRLAEALRDKHFNVTEALAGAPNLIRRFDRASDGARAVLLAAVDARRVGVRAPLGSDLLRDAARAHLTTIQADDEWFSAALSELTDVRGPANLGMAPLVGIPDPERRHVVGYEVADFLLQHLLRRRRREPVPQALWNALAATVPAPADLVRMASSAALRGMTTQQVSLLRKAADVGEQADTLAGRSEIADLSRHALVGDSKAASSLAQLVVIKGLNRPVDPTTQLVVSLSEYEPWRFSDLLAASGDREALRTRASAGDPQAAIRLAGMLQHEDLEQAIAVISPHSSADVPEAVFRHADLLIADRFDDAVSLLRSSEALGASAHLRALYRTRNDVSGLEELAAAGDRKAGRIAIELLTAAENVDALMVRARTGSAQAYAALGTVLEARGDVKTLTELADEDDCCAAKLAEVLTTAGDHEALTSRATRGDWWCLLHLAEQALDIPSSIPAHLVDGGRSWSPEGNRLTGHDVEYLAKDVATVVEALSRRERPDLAMALLINCGHDAQSASEKLPKHKPSRAAAEDHARLASRRLRDTEAVLRGNCLLGSRRHTEELVVRLTSRGDRQAVADLAELGVSLAVSWLASAHLAEGLKDTAIEVLLEWIDLDDATTTNVVAGAMTEMGFHEGLRRLGSAGVGVASWRAAFALSLQDDVDTLLSFAMEGNAFAVDYAATALAAAGDTPKALEILLPWVARGHVRSTRCYADLLARRGDTDTALTLLRESIKSGNLAASRQVVHLMVANGYLDQLRVEADNGNRYAARQLARVLAGKQDLDGLRAEVHAANSDDAARALMTLYLQRSPGMREVLEREGLSAEAVPPR